MELGWDAMRSHLIYRGLGGVRSRLYSLEKCYEEAAGDILLALSCRHTLNVKLIQIR
ncbi:hypothetical protein [Nostoc sp. TCL240-02]|uniref:hypothetical protein n=1 Tax=Nostoc sp. TCL240-02 TaxID=2572090 RepID=UPI00157F917A|nr:hypothetical protein [Nostoc sp. TCL240-02]